MVELADAQRVDTFGGLLRDGETAEQALRRLEKSRRYTKLIGTDDGQRLLGAATEQVRDAPNGGVKAGACRGGHPGWRDYICIACGKDVRGRTPGAFRDAGDGASIATAAREVQSLEARGMDLEAAELERSIEARHARHEATETLEHLALSSIDVGENIRIDAGELDDLVASIADVGVLQPVRAIGPNAAGRYRLVWGQRRYLACSQLGLTHIPALVEPAADVDAPGPRRSIEQLAENLIRKDLNAIEEAVALRSILDADPSLTQEKLATKLGRSAPWLSNTLRLLTLVEPVQQALRAGTISQSHGRAIAALPAKQQEEIARHAISDKVSSTQLEREIQWKTDVAKQEAAKVAKTEKWIPKAIAALEAAATPKDVDVSISGSYYDMEVEAVARAVKKAGWEKAHSGSTYYGGYGDAPPKCDCTSVGLAVGGRRAEVTKHCTNAKHVDRARNVDHLADKARNEAVGAKVEELRSRLLPLVDALPLPLLLLIGARSYAEMPELIARQGDEDRSQLRDLVAERLAATADSQYAYGERRGPADKALDDVLAMLEPVARRASA